MLYIEHRFMLYNLGRIYLILMVVLAIIPVATILLYKHAKINPIEAFEIASYLQVSQSSDLPVATSIIFMSGTFYKNKKVNWLNVIFLLVIPLIVTIYFLNLYKVYLIKYIIFVLNNLIYLKYIWLSGIFIGILFFTLSIIIMEFFSKNSHSQIKIPENYPQFIKRWLTALYSIVLDNDQKEVQEWYKQQIIMSSILLVACIFLL